MLIQRDVLWLAATNCYVVARGPGEPALIIDAPPDVNRIGALLAANDLVPGALLLTHGHVDHSGGARGAERSLGVSTWVHPADDFLTLHPGEQLERIFGLGVGGDFEPPIDRIDLEHDQRLDLAGFAVRVRHTPGHTPGHVCFELEGDGVIFSGDQLFAGSVGRTDLPGGSFDQLMMSMRERVLDLDDEVRVLPGHGPETTIGRERRTNPFLTAG